MAPTRVDPPLDAIRDLAGAARVAYAPGYPVGETNFYEEAEPAGQDADRLRAEAVAVAARADLVIAFAGLPLADEREAFDRDHLGLPEAQTRLLSELARLGKPLVVVLQAGSAVVLEPDWHDRTAAVLLTHLGGQAVGAATADLLFGLADPCGRLAETWPLRQSDTPGSDTFPDLSVATYPEGPLIGYRWYDSRGLEVAHPFGHGLSYTTFDYVRLTATDHQDDIEVTVGVLNRGDRAGTEVVQLYATPPAGKNRPRMLVGFDRIRLEPGESGTVRLRIPRRHLAFWSPSAGWRQPAGKWRSVGGSSSRDLHLTAVVDLPARSFSA